MKALLAIALVAVLGGCEEDECNYFDETCQNGVDMFCDKVDGVSTWTEEEDCGAAGLACVYYADVKMAFCEEKD